MNNRKIGFTMIWTDEKKPLGSPAGIVEGGEVNVSCGLYRRRLTSESSGPRINGRAFYHKRKGYQDGGNLNYRAGIVPDQSMIRYIEGTICRDRYYPATKNGWLVCSRPGGAGMPLPNHTDQ